MTELEILRQRRALVTLSCEVQRATLARRLELIEEHPAGLVLRIVTSVASVFVAPRLAFLAYTLARRMLLRSRTAS